MHYIFATILYYIIYLAVAFLFASAIIIRIISLFIISLAVLFFAWSLKRGQARQLSSVQIAKLEDVVMVCMSDRFKCKFRIRIQVSNSMDLLVRRRNTESVTWQAGHASHLETRCCRSRASPGRAVLLLPLLKFAFSATHQAFMVDLRFLERFCCGEEEKDSTTRLLAIASFVRLRLYSWKIESFAAFYFHCHRDCCWCWYCYCQCYWYW